VVGLLLACSARSPSVQGPCPRAGNRGSERVVLTAREQVAAPALASEFGRLASAASAAEAIRTADAVVLAIKPFESVREVVSQHRGFLEGKVEVDVSNVHGQVPDGSIVRTLPPGQSSGAMVAVLLPPAPTS